VRWGEEHFQARWRKALSGKGVCHIALRGVAFWDMEMLCVYDLFAVKVARYWEDKEEKLSAF
jgi:hypothetical protein